MTIQEISAYQRLTNIKFGELNTPQIPTFFPQPTEKQYTRGYFNRYFVRRYDGPTTEVDIKFYNGDFNDLPKDIYKRGTLKWFISDQSTLLAPYTVGTVKAEDRNKSEIDKLLPQFPDLDAYLNDLSQFKDTPPTSETPEVRDTTPVSVTPRTRY